jgi:hypothetical protein
VEEVGEIIGIPQSTVKTRMFYARKQLADLLKGAGVDTLAACDKIEQIQRVMPIEIIKAGGGF